MQKRLEIKVYGLVQGVLFRAEAKRLALPLNLTGFAANRNDGSVEIIAEGEETNLKKLLVWAKRGPELAKVEKIETYWESSSGEFNGFKIE